MTVRAPGLLAFLGTVLAMTLFFAARSNAAGPTTTVVVPAVFTDPADQNVAIKFFRFTPSTYTVTVGSTVTWYDYDERVEGTGLGFHNVVSTNGSWSPVPCDLNKGDPCVPYGKPFRVTFSTPGTYDYFCEPHSGMRGKIVVTG